MASKSKGSIRIPLEIITEILYHLLAKSLGRFRFVSKEWLSLILEPKFIRTHLKTLKQNHIIFSDYNLLYSHGFRNLESLLTPTKFHIELVRLKLCGSCDGLVLVSTFNNNNGTHVVLNPTTREFEELPDSGFYKMDHENFLIYTMEGFGYDFVTDDYKVVIITFFRNNEDLPVSVFVHVYSIQTNTWTWLIDSVYDDYCYRNDVDVFVNGFIHWISVKKSIGLHVIVAFNLEFLAGTGVPWPEIA